MQFEPFGLFSCKLKLSKMLGNEILFPDFTSCFWFPRNVFFFFFFFFFGKGGGGGFLRAFNDVFASKNNRD